MFPREIWFNPIWCLYDNMSGKIILKHPYHKGLNVPCPYCAKNLIFKDYKASCCNQEFKTGFNEVIQREPYGTHQRNSGRGWASIRPFKQ